jgi:hypothetical protein
MVNMAARMEAPKCAKPQGVQRLYALVIPAGWGHLRSLLAPLLGRRRALADLEESTTDRMLASSRSVPDGLRGAARLP